MAKNNTTRNILLGAFALFLLWPKKSTAGGSGGTPLGQPSPNGYTPMQGSNGSMNESYLHHPSATRGIRNNNPGNEKFGASQWQGKIPESQNTDAKVSNPSHPRFGQPTFEQFQTWKHGIRVMIYELKNNYIGAGYNTIQTILQRYDPGYNQNYLNFLVSYVGIPATQVIAVNNEAILKKLVMGIAKFENSSWGAGDPDIVTSAAYDTARSIL